MRRVVLRPGRDRSVRRRHPWLLSGSVDRVDEASDAGDDAVGAEVAVVSAEGEVLGHGHLSPASQIRVRLFHFGKEAPGPDWLELRIRAAFERRADCPLLGDTDAMRLVNAEGDGLPGLTVDRYADVVVAQLTSAGMARRRDEIARLLRAASGAAAGVERSDATAARREGIAAAGGALWGAVPDAPVWIREADRRYAVDVSAGQKTGFYLDQRDSRALAAQLAPGRRVLDLFAYSGGFSVAAASGGAESVTLVESSADACALAQRNLEENAPGVPAALIHGDAHRALRGSHDRFELIVVDPPPFARRRAHVDRAARAYKDVLLEALRYASPGAYLLAFACSQHISSELFRKICFGASVDADRPLRVLRCLGLPADHPVALDHPEGDYFSGLLLEA